MSHNQLNEDGEELEYLQSILSCSFIIPVVLVCVSGMLDVPKHHVDLQRFLDDRTTKVLLFIFHDVWFSMSLKKHFH
jgi:hypothetical protein